MSSLPLQIVICIGGEAPTKNPLYFTPDVCIAADAGISVCKKLGLIPDLMIGDFDSVSLNRAEKFFPNTKTEQHPLNKDMSDTRLALKYVKKHYTRKGILSQITLLGGGGGDIEHFVDILQVFSLDYAPTRMITEHQQLELIKNKFSVALEKGTKISFFPINKVCKQKTKGLQWPLDKLTLSARHTSLRNVVTEEKVNVTMIQGKLLAVWTHKNKVSISSV